MTDYQPSLTTLATLAAKRGVGLSAALERYQQRQQLNNDALVRQLGITQEQLSHLKLCEVPREDHFDEDVRQIAAHLAVDAARLRQVLRS